MTRHTSDSEVRRASQRRGAWSEVAAAAAMMIKGYRILARRWKSHHGEIDLIAVRGKRLAFIEVKQRPTLDEAHFAITGMQSRRVRDAAELWLSRNKRYQDHDIHFDAVFVLPRHWPRHVEEGL